VVQFDRWIKFDKESYKFIITEYGLALLHTPMVTTDDSPETLAESYDHDVAMSNTRHTVVKAEADDAKLSESQLNQYFSATSNLHRSADIHQSENDVEINDSRSEGTKFRNPPGKPVASDFLSYSNNEVVVPESVSPPKVYHQTFISDLNKLEAMNDFDKPDSMESGLSTFES